MIFWLTVVGACYFAFRPMSPGGAEATDKFNHMLAFATLTVLAANAYGLRHIGRIVERLAFFGAMIELVQSTGMVHRDCDFLDWVADMVSIMMAAAVMLATQWLYLFRQRRPLPTS